VTSILQELPADLWAQLIYSRLQQKDCIRKVTVYFSSSLLLSPPFFLLPLSPSLLSPPLPLLLPTSPLSPLPPPPYLSPLPSPSSSLPLPLPSHSSSLFSLLTLPLLFYRDGCWRGSHGQGSRQEWLYIEWL